jgi:cell division septation protein DedD
VVRSSQSLRRWNVWAYTETVDSPLKERLTGALIVIAVLVIVVPEMLSGPDGSQATTRTAGDAGPPERTFTLELGTPAATRTQDQSSLTPQSSDVQEPAQSAGTPAASAPEPLAVPAPVTAAASPPPPPVATPSPAPADVKPPPAAAPAPAAVPAASKGQWWAQLGSFSARDNAERLARGLREKGYAVNVAKIKVGTKELYRVRSGPVANREAALALQARLAAAGQKSSLVAP